MERFGRNAPVVWLCKKPEYAEYTYGHDAEGEATKGELTEAETELQTDLQYNLVWWEMMQATLFLPLGSILIVIAVALIVYGIATEYLTS